MIQTIVAGGGNEQDAVWTLVRDRIRERLRESAAAPGVVCSDDVHAAHGECGYVVQTSDGSRGGARAIGAHELARQDLDVPCHAGHADAVVSDGTDGSGDVGTMPIVVGGIGVAIHSVDAVTVVDKSVAVVVDPVRVALRRVAVDVRGQVRMRVVDSGVDDRDHDRAVALSEIPGFRGIDVGVGETAGLTCVIESPLLDEARLIGGMKRIINGSTSRPQRAPDERTSSGTTGVAAEAAG